MIRKINTALHSFETGLLVILLVAMMLLVVLQIVLRNIFGFGIVSAEPLVRVLVLWTALIGAMIGARQGTHIAMEALVKFVNPAAQVVILRVVYVVVGLVCFATAYFCFQFVRVEFNDGRMAFEGTPIWVLQSIMPIAFAVIGWRYWVSALILTPESLRLR